MKKYLPIAWLIFTIILIQLITAVLGKAYFLTQLTMSAYYVLVSIGLCMVMGYAGQISMGQAGFFAIGGYTSAVLTTFDFSDKLDQPFVRFIDSIGMLVERETLYGDTVFHLSPWIAFILAILLAAGMAVLLGIPVLRLKGHYLAMATLGFGIIIYRIVLGTGFLGEADGITNLPGFTLFPGFVISGDIKTRIGNYYFSWILVVLAMVLMINMINSRVGRALRSLHGGEEAADAMGVDTTRYKVVVFVIGAVLAAVAGVFMTHYNAGIGPSESSVMKSVRYVAIVAVGGMANLWGTLIMGLVLNFLSLRGVFGHFDDAVFGIILILMMMFMPEGFIRKATADTLSGWFRKAVSLFKGKKTGKNTEEASDE